MGLVFGKKHLFMFILFLFRVASGMIQNLL